MCRYFFDVRDANALRDERGPVLRLNAHSKSSALAKQLACNRAP